MRTFSLRELVLVLTVFSVAMAVNVWNHQDLRRRLKQAEIHTIHVEAYASQLRDNLQLAKYESDDFKGQVKSWLTSGELKPLPSAPGCGQYSPSPDWTILTSPSPQLRY